MIDKTPQQGSFWDTQWIEHLIDKEGFEYHFRRVVRPLIKDEDFAWAYDPERGRKAIPPSLVACALILQQRYRLSDREMEKQIRFHLAAKYALGLPMDDAGFDHTTLCKFRGMLVENEETRICFDKFRKILIEAKLIRSRDTTFIDTTHVIADIAIPNTIQLITQGMRAVLQAAAQYHIGIGNQLAKSLELGFVYENPPKEGGKERLFELVQGARRLLSYLEKSGDERHPQLVGPVSQLKRILYENTEEKESGRGKRKETVIEEREGSMPDRLVSTVDPDARHGRKSETKKFVGYKAQILENEKGLILDIYGMLGNRHDTWDVFSMVTDVAANGMPPRYVVGDKAYAQDPLGPALWQRGIQMVTPFCSFGVSLKTSFYQEKVIFNQTALYDRLIKMRSSIERKNGQLKNQLGLKRCRYRGLKKFDFQCLFAALTANIQRWITLFLHAPPLLQLQMQEACR